jgi:hypothetical protein
VESCDAALAAFVRHLVSAERGTYARRIATSDPQTAAQWAETIGNERMRNSQIESIVRNWLNTDSSGAKTWISASSLPDEIKAGRLSQE